MTASKNTSCNEQKNNSACASHFKVHFLPILSITTCTKNMKLPNVTLYGGLEFTSNLNATPTIPLQENTPTFDKCSKLESLQ